ncbi:MAG: alpha/beta hydrolase [Oscillospiraceae bacterium]|nr:alpha/beta hydrolase [Oscillospiraceae bacterium]
MMKRITSILLCIVLTAAFALPAFSAQTDALPYDDSAFFEYGDYTIHYRVQRAEPEKGRILFLHGFLASTACWEELSAIMTENGYTCVLMDLPDFGYSSRETAQMERVAREDIVYALMTELSDEPWYLAGHSMGGYTALAVAQKYPESVRNLLLYSTAGNNGIFDLIAPLTKNSFITRILGGMIDKIGVTPTLVKLIMAYATQDDEFVANYDLEKLMAPYRIEGTGAGILRSLSTHTKTDYDAVRQMNPILWINGDRDFVCPEKERMNLRAALPSESVEIRLKGAGHMLIENRAEEVAALTLDFLEKNP